MKTRKNIARGVALLDEKLPGWEERVNLNRLDLSSTCDCVCGQIVTKKDRWWSRYRHGLAVLGIEEHHAGRYGFVATGNTKYASLTDEWARVIRAKRRGEEITS